MLKRARECHLGKCWILTVLFISIVVELVAIYRFSIFFLKNRCVINPTMVLALRNRYFGHIERYLCTNLLPLPVVLIVA